MTPNDTMTIKSLNIHWICVDFVNPRDGKSLEIHWICVDFVNLRGAKSMKIHWICVDFVNHRGALRFCESSWRPSTTQRQHAIGFCVDFVSNGNHKIMENPLDLFRTTRSLHRTPAPPHFIVSRDMRDVKDVRYERDVMSMGI